MATPIGKPWTEMSPVEKCEELRENLKNLYSFSNEVSKRVGMLAKRVEKLERGGAKSVRPN